MSKCGACNKSIPTKTVPVKCLGVCNKIFHADCIGPDEDTRFNAVNFKAWKCEKCNGDNFNITMNMMISVINKTLENRFNSLVDDLMERMDKRLDNLEQRVSKLEDLNNQHKDSINSIGSDMEEWIAEMDERKKRSKNVILFNVRESQETDIVKKVENDTNIVKSILSQRSLEIVPSKIIRLGRVRPNNSSRPLKIILNNPEEAKLLLKSNYPECQYQFRSDRTQKQMEYFKQIKETLNRRKSEGEHNIIIKYRNDVPYITIGVPKNQQEH